MGVFRRDRDRAPSSRSPARRVLFHVTGLALLLAALLFVPPIAAQDGVPIEQNDALAEEPSEPVAKQSDASVEILLDERYGDTEGREGTCDVYLPQQPIPAGGRPAVVMLHGGGWSSGDKWFMHRFSYALAEQGCVAISANYRLAPEYKFPAQVDDVRTALIWTVEQQQRFGIDVNRLGLCGYSAGGHLAVLIGVLQNEPDQVQQAASEWAAEDERWKRLPDVKAVCGGGPPCEFRDLPPGNTALAYFFGGPRKSMPDVYRSASPVEHASAGDPITQIIHGETDMIVPTASSRALEQALTNCGVECRYELIPGQGHLITYVHDQTRATIVAFFSEVL